MPDAGTAMVMGGEGEWGNPLTADAISFRLHIVYKRPWHQVSQVKCHPAFARSEAHLRSSDFLS
jgi:hypothetical protein